jgi:hypothetical protein
VSVYVYIDGQPAERSEEYFEVRGKLGATPMSRRKRFELWASEPPPRVTPGSVRFASAADNERREWLRDGGAILESGAVSVKWRTVC